MVFVGWQNSEQRKCQFIVILLPMREGWYWWSVVLEQVSVY
jgi:hypothetical protein